MFGIACLTNSQSNPPPLKRSVAVACTGARMKLAHCWTADWTVCLEMMLHLHQAAVSRVKHQWKLSVRPVVCRASSISTACALWKVVSIWSFKKFRYVKLRLSFPSCSQTTSPLQILPQFVEVLGRKMDKTQTELDLGACFFANIDID